MDKLFRPLTLINPVEELIDYPEFPAGIMMFAETFGTDDVKVSQFDLCYN